MPKQKPKEELNRSSMSEQKIENSKDTRILAAIGYLWILCLLPLLGKRESSFTQFHGKQGLVLTIVSFAVGIMAWIPIIGFLAWLVGIGLIVLAVQGIQHAMQGEYWEMPVLGKYAKQIKL